MCSNIGISGDISNSKNSTIPGWKTFTSSLIGIFAIPALYVTVQDARERVKGTPRPAEP